MLKVLRISGYCWQRASPGQNKALREKKTAIKHAVAGDGLGGRVLLGQILRRRHKTPV